jgi:hypothetical protein
MAQRYHARETPRTTPEIVMRRLALALVPILAVLTIAAAPQKRAAKKGPADFNTLITEAKAAWDGKQFGACLAKLREATSLATLKRIEAVLATFPPAPEGFEKVENELDDQARADRMMGGLGGAFGSVIEQRYKGEHRIDVTVTADSPMVQMFSMALGNPALMDKDSERIEYGQDEAILKKTANGRARELTIIVAGKHIVLVNYGSDDEDALFAMFDQAFVDRLSAALAE